MRLVKIILGTSVGIVVVLAVIGALSPNHTGPVQAQPAVQTADAAAARRPALPAAEQNFVNIVGDYTNRYNQAANDMQKGAVRAARRTALCQAFPAMHVSDWVGTIATLSATGSGKGVLSVSLTQDLMLSTDNNDFSDSLNHTTIPAGSALFNAVSQMKSGEMVIFSGDFLLSDNDCFNETSLTTDGGMQQPNFSFRFSAVKDAPAS